LWFPEDSAREPDIMARSVETTCARWKIWKESSPCRQIIIYHYNLFLEAQYQPMHFDAAFVCS
jgi:hypothetical protein